MKRVCAWCGAVMEEGDPECTDISHGICPPCQAAWRADAQATVDAERLVRQKEKGAFDAKL